MGDRDRGKKATVLFVLAILLIGSTMVWLLLSQSGDSGVRIGSRTYVFTEVEVQPPPPDVCCTSLHNFSFRGYGFSLWFRGMNGPGGGALEANITDPSGNVETVFIGIRFNHGDPWVYAFTASATAGIQWDGERIRLLVEA